MNVSKYSKISINLIIVLVVPFLILGPFLPDLIVSISVLFFLYHILKKNDFYYLNNKVFKIFLLFCIISTICSLESKNISLSIQSSLFYFRIGVLGSLSNLVIQTKRRQERGHFIQLYQECSKRMETFL